jgi:ribosomal protein S18 acetylase RimI-like enzyme
MTYRIATKNDAHAIAQLHTNSWRVSYRGILNERYLETEILQDRLQLWTKRLAQPTPTQYVLLATEGDKLCGFVCVYGDDDERWGALIDNLHVSPELKGRGIGAGLMRKAASWILQNYPYLGLYLWVYADNQEAIQFYERMSGTKVGSKIHNNPGGGSANAIRYVWKDLKSLIDSKSKHLALVAV